MFYASKVQILRDYEKDKSINEKRVEIGLIPSTQSSNVRPEDQVMA